jgi:cyclic pyranopterin phosphate synthase
MTTNGVLLKRVAGKLRDAGLRRVNVSLPSLNRDNFRKITGKNNLSKVKEGVEAAIESDLNPVKLNVVLLNGVNDDEVPAMIDFAHRHGATLQLIEFQPILEENINLWSGYHYDLTSLERQLQERAVRIEHNDLHKRRKFFLEKNANNFCVETVRPMHNSSFCRNCTRLRVTSDGKLKPCLMRQDNLVEAVSLIGKSPDKLEEAYKKAVRLREPWWR